MAEIAIAAISLAVSVFSTVKSLYDSSTTNVPVSVDQTMDWLGETQALLQDAEDQIDGGSKQLQHYVKEVEHLAYKIEDALSVFVRRIHGKGGFQEKLHNIVSFLPGKLKIAESDLASEIARIKQNNTESVTKLKVILQSSSSSSNPEGINCKFDPFHAEGGDYKVGFTDREEELIGQLRAADGNRLALVAGPGGSGKSTMVDSVYRSVTAGFSCKAWVDVPRMKLNMIPASRQGGNNSRGETDDALEPEEKLRLRVEGERYLVVLDNVWSKSRLENIVGSLPEGLGLSGSKIIITTRNSDVTYGPPNYIHDLSSGLSPEEAKQLFCRKAFQNNEGHWPELLDEWAQKILNRCEGLPLPISAIGRSLGKQQHHNPNEWRDKHAKLGYEICKEDSDLFVIKKNLQPSYEDLPSHLRSCYLYLSMFPENYSISREKLIRLWVAEGFVMPEDGEPKEKVAGDYLDELYKRNLVVACAKDADGQRVRRCRVLNLAREINISRRKNFLTVLDQNYNLSGGDGIRRLSVNNGPWERVNGKISGTRTLLVFGRVSSHPELEKILKTSKFLRVLDLQGLALETIPEHVFRLTLLKYLSMKDTHIKIVPDSIKKLIYLETLDIRHTNVSCLPEEIFKLKMLRHLLVFCNGGSGGVVLPAGNLGALSSIQKLSLIKVETNSAILEALAELTGLMKLGLTDLKEEDGSRLCGSLLQMKSLSTLDVRATNQDEYLDLNNLKSHGCPRFLKSLYLEGRLERVPQWIPELKSLTKIGLKWSKLQDNVDPLWALQALPNLMELNLSYYYMGKELVFICETFVKLLALSIEEFDELECIIVQDGAMCQLKKAIVCNCRNLRSVPESLTALEGFRRT